MIANAIRTGEGFPTSAVSMLEPVATTPQKNSVAFRPAIVPIGTVKLLSRQSLSAQVIGCLHCSFVFGPCRAVVEAAVILAPAALETEPRVRLQVGRLAGGDEVDPGPKLARRAGRVVAADALRGAAAEVQRGREVVRVRAQRCVDDRVRAAHEHKLRVAPPSALGAFVLAVADDRRLPGEGLRGRRGVEVELDHLPVAFVLVVEVVEDVEEPVLQRELSAVIRVVGDPRVRHGTVAVVQPVRPFVVRAAGRERVPGEVEVIAPEPGAEIRSGGCDLRDVRVIPRAAQCNIGVPEHEIHVGRHERFAVAAGFRLLDEADDRCVAVRQRLGSIGRVRNGRRHRRGNGQNGENRAPSRSTLAPQPA